MSIEISVNKSWYKLGNPSLLSAMSHQTILPLIFVVIFETHSAGLIDQLLAGFDLSVTLTTPNNLFISLFIVLVRSWSSSCHKLILKRVSGVFVCFFSLQPFRCAHCRYSCNSPGPLKRHYKMKHPDHKYHNTGPGLTNTAETLEQQGPLTSISILICMSKYC